MSTITQVSEPGWTLRDMTRGTISPLLPVRAPIRHWRVLRQQAAREHRLCSVHLWTADGDIGEIRLP